MSNPILARIEQALGMGLHPKGVRVSAAGKNRWAVTLTMDGASSRDDVTEIDGTENDICGWIAEVSRIGRAVDWARFDGDGDGYPAYLTKPSAWLREGNPFRPDDPRNPASRNRGPAPTNLKSFAELSAVWQTWEHTDVSARAFCDWIRDNDYLDPYWLDPLQRWLTGGGLGFFEAELRRLTRAEAAHFAKEGAARGQKTA